MLELPETERHALALEMLGDLDPLPEMPGEVVDEETAARAWAPIIARRIAERDPSKDLDWETVREQLLSRRRPAP